MVKAARGVLVQCDPSIKAIICNIDEQANHDFIIDDLDDETVFVKTDKLDELKRRLQEKLKDTQMEVDDSGSE